MSLKGKRLLVLGGIYSNYDLVLIAKQMGVYTITVDYYKNGVAKDISDESAQISTADIDTLAEFIREKKIDGVFCGPSEPNIRNMIELCERTGLPCYTDMETWNRCANKDVFKMYCRKYGVDCTPEYDISEDSSDEILMGLDYPVIVKPVDSSASRGITTCKDWTEVREACLKARKASQRGKIIVEKFIENSGDIFSASYLLKDGEAYPYLLRDTYIVDPINRKTLISGFSIMPSRLQKYYLNTMDEKVRNMLKGMGLRNGVAFFQALPYKDKIYFHEMGFRLSGGLIFKIAEPLCHVNDLKMMICYALGEEICSDDEIKRIDVNCSGKTAAKLMVPLEPGQIGSIAGLEEVKRIPCVKGFLQCHNVGDEIKPNMIGTLSQHFGRFTLIADRQEEIFDTVRRIQSELMVYDVDGNLMNDMPFDLNRVNPIN